jgi:hypothetical protein
MKTTQLTRWRDHASPEYLYRFPDYLTHVASVAGLNECQTDFYVDLASE